MDQAAETRIRQGYAKQGFMALIGAEMTALSEGACEIHLPSDQKVKQQHGLFHGGVIAALADTAAGFAAYSVMEDGRQPLTIEFKINYLAPGLGDALVAKAQVLRAGRSIQHLSAEVIAIDGSEETLVATALLTMKSTSAVEEI
ncbi:MAG: PaaI family thioesterase [Pseudomonadota bacterium]